MDIPARTDRPFAVSLSGGLDVETPVVARAPGWLVASEGYEPKVGGGYARLGGCERYDGRPSPSSASIVVIGAQNGFEAMTPGDSLAGTPSGASGTVVWADASMVALIRVTGTFASGDSVAVSGVAKGIAILDPSFTALQQNDMLAAAEDFLRDEVGPVPGLAGTPVRGVCVLYDVLYAWRDHDALTQKVFKATPTGWQEVPLLQRIAFTNGTTEYAEGSTLSKGGVTATIKRVVVQGGDPEDWPGLPTSGWFIISGASGTFTAGVAGGGGVATLSGAQEQIVLASQGRWEMRTYNFFGGLSRRIYGADGKNDLIEFDGEVLAPIPVSMPVKPVTLELHKQQLFAAFGTSIQSSAIGNPHLWTVITGSAELAMGDTVTGLISVAGSETEAAMLVTSRNSSSALYGDAAEYRLSTLSKEVGAHPYTLQEIGKVIGLDTAGMRDFSPSQAFGNFSSATITDHIKSLATNLSARASVISKETGRYRLFLSDGRMLTGANGKRWAWTFSRIPFGVNVACEGEISGTTRVFIGCDDGYVREMDRGRSMDGESLTYWLKTTPTNMGTAGSRKQVANPTLEAATQSAGSLKIHLEPDYGDHERLETMVASSDLPSPPTNWDVDNWDSGFWDGQSGQTLRLRTRATGETFSVTVFNESRTELPHEITSMNLPHRMLRRVR